MKNKLYRKYIVLIVAAIASAVVWIQSFTQPNVWHPFLFSFLFTLVMAFFVWFAFGAPHGKKSIPMKEIIPFLQSIGFEPSSKPLDVAPISSAQTTKLTHGSMLAIVIRFHHHILRTGRFKANEMIWQRVIPVYERKNPERVQIPVCICAQPINIRMCSFLRTRQLHIFMRHQQWKATWKKS